MATVGVKGLNQGSTFQHEWDECKKAQFVTVVNHNYCASKSAKLKISGDIYTPACHQNVDCSKIISYFLSVMNVAD